jgi:hypothetical protein
VIEAENRRLAIEERTVDVGHHQPQVLRAEVANQAQRRERAADLVGLFGGKHAVLGGAETAVELDRTDDIARAFTVVFGAADATRVQQLAEVGRRGEVEDALVLGEERPFFADEHFGRVEVHDQVVAFHLAEIWIERGEQLRLAVRLPEHVETGVRLVVAVDHVVQHRDVGRQGEQ